MWMQGVSIGFVWRFEKSCDPLMDEEFPGIPDGLKGCGMRRMSQPNPGIMVIDDFTGSHQSAHGWAFYHLIITS